MKTLWIVTSKQALQTGPLSGLLWWENVLNGQLGLWGANLAAENKDGFPGAELRMCLEAAASRRWSDILIAIRNISITLCRSYSAFLYIKTKQTTAKKINKLLAGELQLLNNLHQPNTFAYIWHNQTTLLIQRDFFSSSFLFLAVCAEPLGERACQKVTQSAQHTEAAQTSSVL